MKKWLAMLLAAAMCVSLAACGGNADATTAAPETTPEATTEAKEENPTGEAGALTAGTYTASAPGMNGNVTVEVTVTDAAIEAVTVTEHQETTGIGAPLMDKKGNVLLAGGEAPTTLIPREIVENQSIKVDTVSGATITSYAIVSAVKDCLTQAGADLAQWQNEVQPGQIAKDGQADVIVVGGGGAGLAAAVSAAQNGASVIVIEKNGLVGGDTLVCGGIYNNPDAALQSKVEMSDAVKSTIEAALAETPVNDAHAALQAEVRKQWDAYKAEGRTDLFDTAEWFALQTWINGDKVGNLDLVKVLTYNAEAGYDWIQTLGMQYTDTIGQGAGSLWQRTHSSVMNMGSGMISTYIENVEASDKITIMTSVSGKSLIQDENGAVVGVVAEDKFGNECTLNASKGVVLATGGFSANGAMVQQYNTSGKWDDLSKVMTTNRYSCSQGDGITMAVGVGASLTDMEQVQLLYLGNVKDGTMTKYPPRCLSGTDQVIFINKEGERFVQEDGRRDQICLAVLQQTDGMYYILESGDGDFTEFKNAVSGDGFSFDYLEENGFIVTGETLEELAGKLGMDYATLQATVDTFNADVEAGKDEEFGRTLFNCKLENGPWVATARTACVHHTMGGVTIDTEGHVLAEDGSIIPGLAAAGEVTGGIHGGNRLGGNAVVDTVVFGKLAGETITK